MEIWGGTQMYPNLWGGFPWFNVHRDRQGAYYSCCSVFVLRPTNRTSMAQGLFGISGRRTGAHTLLAWTKIHSAPSAFPLLGAPQAPGNKTEESKSVVGRSAETGGNLQLPRHTRPDPCRSKHGWPKCNPTTGETQCYYSCCPPLYQLSSWLINALGKSIIPVIGESPTTLCV